MAETNTSASSKKMHVSSQEGRRYHGEARRSEDLTKEIADITTLYNAGIAIGSSLSLKDVIWTIYKESSRLLDTTNFAITIYDEETDTLSFGLVFDDGQSVKPFAVRFSTNQRLTKQVIEQETPFLIPDLSQTDYQTEINRIQSQKQVRAWLGVPITNPTVTNHKAQGALVLWSYQPDVWTDRDMWLASSIGIQAAIAIRNARLFEASQRQAKESMALNEVARTLASTLSLEEVLTRIMEQVGSLLNSEAGALLLSDPTTGELIFQIAMGGRAEEIKPYRIPKGQGIAGEIAVTGKPLLITDVKKDKRHFKALDKQTDFLTRNLLGVPLLMHEQVIGVLEVMNKRSGNYNSKDLELLEAIASYAAIAIENAKLHKNVLAERDRVIAAEEQARKELARDLHDGPTQLVAGIMMSLDFCKMAWQKDRSLIPKELDDMMDLAGRANHQMRTMLFELRPLVLETSGLQPAIEVFLNRRQKDTEGVTELKLEVKTDNASGEITRQEQKVENTIFAIVQETVNNAIKHAKAANIVVTLEDSEEGLYTTITDDGVGFDVDAVLDNYEERGSLGMINLQERTELIGGELAIESTPGQGSRFSIFVPKAQEERSRRQKVTGPLSLADVRMN